MIKLYEQLKSVHKVGKILKVSGDTIHQRLLKLGKLNPSDHFTKEELKIIKNEYLLYRDFGKLSEFSNKLNRQKTSICRAAKRLGMTDQKHQRIYAGKWKYMDEQTARMLMDNFKKSSLTLGRYCKKKGFSETGFWQTMNKYFPDEYEPVIESKQPHESLYRYGRRFEYRIKKDLKEKGYFVLRSPASRSPIDLVAIRKGIILFVQCKVGGALPVKEWNELWELSKGTGATPILASRIGYREFKYERLLFPKDGTKKAQPKINIELLKR